MFTETLEAHLGGRIFSIEAVPQTVADETKFIYRIWEGSDVFNRTQLSEPLTYFDNQTECIDSGWTYLRVSLKKGN